MKVLIIATSRRTRGGITSVIRAHEKGIHWDEFNCKWIETHIDRSPIRKIWYFFYSLFLFIVNLSSVDLVHIHVSEPVSAIRKLPFMLLSKLFKKKTIIHFHSYSPDTTINSKFRMIYCYLFRSADVVIVLSEYWRDKLIESVDFPINTRVIFNPCVSEILLHEYPKKEQILYAGTLNARKGYLDLIVAFSKIASRYPKWQIVFAGNGDIDKGKKMAESLGIDNQVLFLGWVDKEKKDKVFKEASIFCLPSYAEGFPMAVLDAWAYGLPVITTPVGGITDIARDGINVMLFSCGDVDALAEVMELMINDEALRNRIINESIKLSKSMFHVNSVNAKIRDLYMELLYGL